MGALDEALPFLYERKKRFSIIRCHDVITAVVVLDRIPSITHRTRDARSQRLPLETGLAEHSPH